MSEDKFSEKMSKEEFSEKITLISVKALVKARFRASIKVLKKHTKMSEDEIKNFLHETVDHAIKKEQRGKKVEKG